MQSFFMRTMKTNQTVRMQAYLTLRKHAHSNILKISQPRIESFQIKILIVFIFLLKNIDCGDEAVLTSTHNLCF